MTREERDKERRDNAIRAALDHMEKAKVAIDEACADVVLGGRKEFEAQLHEAFKAIESTQYELLECVGWVGCLTCSAPTEGWVNDMGELVEECVTCAARRADRSAA